MRSVLATAAVGFALILAGLTDDPRPLIGGAVAAVALAGWTDARRPDSVRTPRVLP